MIFLLSRNSDLADCVQRAIGSSGGNPSPATPPPYEQPNERLT
jgi:hypothetical protein